MTQPRRTLAHLDEQRDRSGLLLLEWTIHGSYMEDLHVGRRTEEAEQDFKKKEFIGLM